ncbi:urease accessory protein UreD [Pedococcus sp. KACC 23699]|uniref:Urease accessory protein UreD n=1 Tax=Pedococcus sp. KACC 23699 TaxID=3149228 RepID=A0AAU7JP44_9MICO
MPTRTEVRTARVALLPDAGGQARLDLRGGLVSPRVVRQGAASAEVALIATTATLLGGDELRLSVEVGPGLRLDLRDVAGTVAYHGRGQGCLVAVSLTVHPGAVLVWSGEPLVVCDGAQVVRTLDVEVADAGRLLLRDRVALGRTGQAGGDLTCRTTMTYGARPALVEELTLGARSRTGAGVLGGARVVDSVTALGWRPADTRAADSEPGTAPYARADGAGRRGAAVFTLHEPGALARQVVTDAHASALPHTWARWTAELPSL